MNFIHFTHALSCRLPRGHAVDCFEVKKYKVLRRGPPCVANRFEPSRHQVCLERIYRITYTFWVLIKQNLGLFGEAYWYITRNQCQALLLLEFTLVRSLLAGWCWPHVSISTNHEPYGYLSINHKNECLVFFFQIRVLVLKVPVLIPSLLSEVWCSALDVGGLIALGF